MTGEDRVQEELFLLEEAVRAGYRGGGLTPGVVDSFHRLLALVFAKRGRDLPWRRTTDPYRILVSEFMLQQTQVERVLVKYPGFLARFPDAETLARAPVEEVLRAWQGLGYNRRALSLHRTARRILEEFGGEVPLDRATLDSFPGIGNATAGAVVVFSTNRPEIFIETNIRRVYIHLFFPEGVKVHDREIVPLLERTLDRENPRRFYYTLMDYGSALGKGLWDPNGSALKKGERNPNLRSAMYTRQGPFEGSDRQARGMILRHILLAGDVRELDLIRALGIDPEKVKRLLMTLEKEGFVCRTRGRLSIPR